MRSTTGLGLGDWIGQLEGVARNALETWPFAFSIARTGLPKRYGEWRSFFALNETDFSVQIVSFGFTHISEIGNLFVSSRVSFGLAEIHCFSKLLVELFNDSAHTSGMIPFSSPAARFDGRVTLLPNWVRVTP